MWFKNFIFCLISFHFFSYMVHVLCEKMKMISPSIFSIFSSKTDEFPRQQHVSQLKLRHVATKLFFSIFFLILILFFKKKKNNNLGHMGWVAIPILAKGHPQGQFWGWPNHTHNPTTPKSQNDGSRNHLHLA
jgi:ABC-type uncharacterized transport system permease subunit